MDLLLLFNLLLGSLLVFPYLSKGETVEIDMPDYATVGKELRIKCSYSNFGNMSEMVLDKDGNEKVRLDYDIDKSRKQGKAVFAISPLDSGISFVVDAGTTAKNGALTFVIGQIKCDDLSTYKCISVSGVSSKNKTLQVLPEFGSISSNTTHLIVHEDFTFTCKGTVNKTGPFTVQWYRGTISNTTEVTPPEPPKIIAYNECSRTIESQLSYNVTESDVPNLTLWCRIENVEHKRNFTVKEPPPTPQPTTVPTTEPTTESTPKPTPQTTPKPSPKPTPKPEPQKASHNSGHRIKTKTFVMALNSGLFFLFLFSLLD